MIGRWKKLMLIILVVVFVIAAAFVVVSIIMAKQKEPVKDKFIPIDGSQYVDENGEPDKNIWLTENGRKYYIGDDGVIIKDQMFEIEGKEYLFDKDGVLRVSEKLIIDDKLYLIDENGVVSVNPGWLEVDGEQYYGKEDGTIVRGWTVKDKNKEYYLDEEGHLVKNQTLLYQGKIYATDDKGVMKAASGWQEVDGKRYYGKADGSIARNTTAEENGSTFYLDEEGQLVKSSFYTYNDALYYADASGNTRKEEGWFTLDGKEYYSDSEGVFYQSTYITVDKKKYFMDKTGAKIEGKPTIDQYLKCDDIYEYMTSHFNDYYFKTPYRDLYGNTNRPERLIMPIGEYGDDAGMNCTGFISSLVKGSGGDLDLVTAMGRFGGYGNADNYLMLATKGYVRYEVFRNVDELLKSGRAKKGNIFYLAPKWKSGDDCHMAVFWGDTSSENKIWSQTAKTLCTVTEIYMVDPINQIFMFPLERNLDVYED